MTQEKGSNMNESDQAAINNLKEQLMQITSQMRVIADRNSQIRLDFAISKLLQGIEWIEEEMNGEKTRPER